MFVLMTPTINLLPTEIKKIYTNSMTQDSKLTLQTKKYKTNPLKMSTLLK